MEINESSLALLEQTNPGAFTISKVTPNGIEMLYASPEAAKVVGMEQDVRLAALSAYYDAQQALKTVQVDQESVDNYSRHLDNVRAQYAAGNLPKSDVLRSEVELADAQQALLKSADQPVLYRQPRRRINPLLLHQPDARAKRHRRPERQVEPRPHQGPRRILEPRAKRPHQPRPQRRRGQARRCAPGRDRAPRLGHLVSLPLRA